MKHALFLLALTACTAAVPPEPSAPEAALVKASAEAPPDTVVTAQGNTYAQSCGPVRARFEAEALPAVLTTRLTEAAAYNARSGGTLAQGTTPEALSHPVPDGALLGLLRSSVACNVIFDLDAAGVPQAIAPRCSNTEFEKVAADAMKAARFKPVMRAGKAVAHKGIVYPMDFCFND